MTNRTLSVAVCLAILGVLAAWLTRPHPKTPGPAPAAPAAAARAFTLGLDPPSVTGVSFTSGGFRAGLAGPEPWVLSLPVEGSGRTTWPAEPDAVRAMLRAAASARLTPRREDSNGPDQAASPLAEIRFTRAGGGDLLVEPLGPPLAGRVPVRVTTPDGVRTADVPADRFRPLSIGDLAALAAPRPFDTPGVITSITVTTGEAADGPNPGGVLSLRRTGGLWSLEGMHARLDQRAVSGMVASLRAVRMADILVPVPTDAIEPRYTIETAAEQPRRPGEAAERVVCRLEIGRQANIEGDIRARATREADGSHHECRITLDADSFPAIPSNPDALLDAVPLPFPGGEAGSCRIERGPGGAHAATLRRTLEGWTAGDRPADTAALAALLGSLASAHPVSLHNETGVEPIARITIDPIGAAPSAAFTVSETDTGAIVSDGAADWRIDTPAFIAALKALAP